MSFGIDLGGLIAAIAVTPDSSGGCTVSAASLAALSARQQRFYNHKIDIWRFDYAVDATTKEAGAPTWHRIGACIPCRVVHAQSAYGNTPPGIRAEGENMLVLDSLHLHLDVAIDVGDAVVIRSDTDQGQIFMVQGRDQPADLWANKKVMKLSLTQRASSEIDVAA